MRIESFRKHFIQNQIGIVFHTNNISNTIVSTQVRGKAFVLNMDRSQEKSLNVADKERLIVWKHQFISFNDYSRKLRSKQNSRNICIGAYLEVKLSAKFNQEMSHSEFIKKIVIVLSLNDINMLKLETNVNKASNIRYL